MSHRDIRGLFSRSSTIEAQYTAVRERLLTAIAFWRSGEVRELPDPRAMQAAHSDDGRSAVSFLGVPEYFAQLEKTVILESHIRIVLDDLVSIMAELEGQQQDRTGPSIEVFAEGARSAAEVLQSDGGHPGNGGV